MSYIEMERIVLDQLDQTVRIMVFMFQYTCFFC